MAFYRKKPVVVEAVKFTRDNFQDIRLFTDFTADNFTVEPKV